MRFIWGTIKVIFILGAAIAVAGSAIVSVLGFLSVPPDDELVYLGDLDQPVDVFFDPNGIPTIRATTMRDSYRALGYLHARDRLWQMEAMRRIGSGRLAEVLGPMAVETDRLMRELDLSGQANMQEERLPETVLAAFQAYVDGVNSYLEDRPRPLPIEFQLLWLEPEPWSVHDSLLWGRLMSVQLSGDAFREEPRLDLLGRLGETLLEDFLPDHSDGPVTLDESNSTSWTHPYDASNAWVLDGSRTDTGYPILANDPHLGLGMPGQWYLARVETPNLTIVGATAPGVPLHVLGHNHRIAWGMTTTHADTQDTVILSSVEHDALLHRDDVIGVRFSDDIQIQIAFNARGTVITRVGNRPTLMQWTGADHDQDTPLALYELNRARNWQEFAEALQAFDDPVQNIFYADIDGHIGMQVAGRLPTRQPGISSQLPVAQRAREGYWVDRIGNDLLPGAFNPSNGYLMNANNRIIDDDYPYEISGSFEPGYRASRLIELLESTGGRHTIADSMAMQNDILSNAARSLVPLLVDADTTSENGRRSLNILSDWDYRMTREDAAPLIFSTLVNELVRVLAEDEIGSDAIGTYWRANPTFVHTALRERTDWCDDTRTGPVEPCRWALGTAFERALHRLEETYGPDPSRWRWGEAHSAPIAHPVLGHIPILSWLSDRPTETPGGDDTLNRGQSPGGSGSDPFRHIHGASMRAIYDLSNLDNSRFALAGGQSGNPFSKHYGDLIEDWRDGRYFRIPGRGGDIAEESAGVVRFLPATDNSRR